MYKCFTFLLLMVIAVPAHSKDWASRQITIPDNYFLTLEFFTNASGVVEQSFKDGELVSSGYRNDTPLIIYSTAKRLGDAISGACQAGFLQGNNGCYTCPADFDVQMPELPDSHRKCIKTYTSTKAFDTIYTEALLAKVEPQLTQRQLRCILTEEQCYTSYTGELESARYGINCGLQEASDNPFLLDNLDKCCLAHSQLRWSNNVAEGNNGNGASCANDINLLRCARKIVVDQHYVTDEEKEAALLTVNRLATPLMTSCPLGVSAITGDDGGAYPWNANHSKEPDQAYTHKFENSSWAGEGKSRVNVNSSQQEPSPPSTVIDFTVQ